MKKPYVSGQFDYYKFRGEKWNHNNLEHNRRYQKNAYRVLLTRARQGLIIYDPEGADKSVDKTREKECYDGIYEYLVSCGIETI